MTIIKDDAGKVSSTRASMILCTITACYLAIVGLHVGADLLALSPVIAMLLGIPGAVKVGQKGQEK